MSVIYLADYTKELNEQRNRILIGFLKYRGLPPAAVARCLPCGGRTKLRETSAKKSVDDSLDSTERFKFADLDKKCGDRFWLRVYG
jgi:hypothetical protein